MEAGFSRCPEADKPAELNGLPVGAPAPLCPEAVLLYFFLHNPRLQRYECIFQLILTSELTSGMRGGVGGVGGSQLLQGEFSADTNLFRRLTTSDHMLLNSSNMLTKIWPWVGRFYIHLFDHIEII